MAGPREKLNEVLDMLEAARGDLKPWITNRKELIATAEVELHQNQNKLAAVEAGIKQIKALLEFLPDG